MPEPVFTEVGQIGMVVHDLDATVKRYVEDYGIGPWEFFEVTPEKAPNLLENGEPIKWSARSATTKVGSVWWELTQPDPDSILGRFLAEKGEGVHHIAVKTPSYDRAIGMQKEPLPLSGSFMDIRVSYLPTEKDLGVVLEVFDGLSD